ncbi:AABR07030053.1 [Phodopus roborovskii]|uniref:AABR07030053.1 protein n=1 Tax=Phodopus roborovskii TaxID=109678 RepID=A0AAU9Z0Y6_PHORO|nr:AABR07030053.1 [Phodopus roborovskii]
MLPFTTSQPREGWKPLQGHAARTRDLCPEGRGEASLIEMHSVLQRRLRPCAHVGAGEAGLLPRNPCRVLPSNELPGPKVSFPRLLTWQPSRVAPNNTGTFFLPCLTAH